MKFLKVLLVITLISVTNGSLAEDWSFDSAEDPLTDKITVYGAKDELVLLCDEIGLRVSIHYGIMGNLLTLGGRDTLNTVTYRFDKETPITTKDRWSLSGSRQALVLPKSISKSFFRSVFSSDKVVIQAYDSIGVPQVKIIDLRGASEEQISNLAEVCGVEVNVSEELLTAQNLLPEDLAGKIENWGPKYTECKKGGLKTLGFWDESDLDSKKDAKFYTAIASYIESFPKLCKDRRKLKIKGMKGCKNYSAPHLMFLTLYKIGEATADDKDAYVERCGRLRSHN